MMRSNALVLRDDVWVQVVDAGRGVTIADVSFMLKSANWRPVIMGAWFSLAVSAAPIMDDLIEAMSTSRGSLTAPPLAAATALLAGAAAAPSLLNYIEYITDPRLRDGSEAVAAAAVEHLGGDPGTTVTEYGRAVFGDLYALGSRFRETWQPREEPERPGLA